MFKSECPFNEINLLPFDDGYTANEIDCIEQAIGVASSIFDEENYHYYAFLTIIDNLWNDINHKEDNILKVENRKLNKLGIQFCKFNIEASYKFLPFVKKIIAINIPIIYLPKRNSISYCSDYQRELENLHAILIIGYGKYTDQMVIRDISHIESSGVKWGGKYGMFKLYLKSSILQEIYNESNLAIKNNKYLSMYANSIFYLEKIKTSEYINDYVKLFMKTKNTIEKENKLLILLKKLENEIDNNEIKINYWQEKSRYEMLNRGNKLSVEKYEELKIITSKIRNDIYIIIKQILSKLLAITI